MSARKSLFCILALAFSVLLLEGILSGLALVSSDFRFHLTPSWKRNVLRPDPVFGFRMESTYPGNDARGFRNPKALSHCDILAVGDSMTYGFAAPADKCWPRVLGSLTSSEVYNMSCGDYSPCEYNMLLDEGLKLSPKHVVICLYLGNDMANSYRTVYMHGRAKEFDTCHETTRLAIQQAEQDRPFGAADRQQEDRMRAKTSSEKPKSFARTLLANHSSLYATVRFAKETLSSQQSDVSLGESADMDTVERFRSVPKIFIYSGNSELATAFVDPSYYVMAVDLDDPRIQEGYRISMAALDAARTKVESANAKLSIAVMPTKHWVYAEHVRKASDNQGDRDAYDHLVEKEEALWEQVRMHFDANGIEYLHLGEALRELLQQGTRPYPPSTNTHPNATGYSAVAEAIADGLDIR